MYFMLCMIYLRVCAGKAFADVDITDDNNNKELQLSGRRKSRAI